MAYHNTNSTYGARSMYNPGSGLPNNAPQFHPSQSHQQQQQQFHPNAYPQSSAPPTTVHEDTFKKPYLPSKAEQPRPTYLQYAQTPPNNFSYPPPSTAPSTPTTAPFSLQGSSKQIPNPSTPYPPTSSMTVSAPPATSSALSTPTSEAHSQVTDTAPQISRLSPLDQERVDALLNVNNLLLQEVQVLQKIGLKTPQSGNPQSPQQSNPANTSSPQARTEGSDTSPTSIDPPAAAAAAGANPPTKSTSSTPTTTTPTTGLPQQTYNQKRFVEYMKRLQSNIMFLVSMSDTTKQRQKAPYPSHLELLPNWLAEGMKEEEKPQFEALKDGYSKLRELWPDWKPGPPGLNPQQQQAQAQAQNRQQQASAQQIQAPQAQSNVSGTF